MYDLRTYFLLFIIYSFIGWVVEVIDTYIIKRKFVNRGFLIGPYCPIYGYGSILMIIFLNKYLQDPIALFVMAVFICSILEYFTSYIMEKLFKARWWDYSNRKFNINGRICLETLIPFGIGGCFIMYILNPFIVSILNIINFKILNILTILLFIIFIIDNIVSFNIILNVKNITSSIRKDSTEEITKMVKDVLRNKSILSKRLVNAFPHLEAIIKDINKKRRKK